MANYATLKSAIQAAIKQNGNNEITGSLLQAQLLSMINSLGVGYQFVGIATPTTNPGTPDQNVFYLASTAGTYANFSGLALTVGEIAILKYNGAWSKDSTGAASLEKVNQLNQDVNGGTLIVTEEIPPIYTDSYINTNDAIVGNTFLGTPQTLAGTMAYKMAVNAGDTLTIYGLGNTEALCLCIVCNSSNVVTQRIQEDSRIGGYRVTIANDGFVYINLWQYNSSTDRVIYSHTETKEGISAKVERIDVNVNSLNKKVANRKTLFLPDSDFTNILTGVINYYATDQVDVTKEYYLQICGYRNNNKAQTIIQVYDGNNTLVEQVVWNASVSRIYEINCAGFVFLIDSATLPANSSGDFIIYNLHLNKYLQKSLSFDENFVEDLAVPGLRWLKKPFSNKIYETKVIDSLLSISSKTEIVDGLYIRYFGRRNQDVRFLYVQICDSNDNEVSSFYGQVGSIDTVATVITTGTYIFKLKVIFSKALITDDFVDFKNYNIKLDSEYLNAQIRTVGSIVCFGDSITMFKGTGDKSYPDWLQEFSTARVFNCGFGGARLTSRTTPVTNPTNETEAYAPFDISNLIEFICNNDYSKLDAGLQWIVANEGAWLSNLYTANLANVKSIDWTTVDTVIIFGGTNDKSADAAIGVANDDNKTTVMGAVKLISRILLTTYPHIKIYWFTPIVRYFCNTVEERTPETFSDASNLPDYVDAIIQQSINLHLPVCDLYRTLGWNPYNFSEYFQDNDGTHPYKGFKALGLKIDKFLQSN